MMVKKVMIQSPTAIGYHSEISPHYLSLKMEANRLVTKRNINARAVSGKIH
jgi:hypothetical protein